MLHQFKLSFRAGRRKILPAVLLLAAALLTGSCVAGEAASDRVPTNQTRPNDSGTATESRSAETSSTAGQSTSAETEESSVTTTMKEQPANTSTQTHKVTLISAAEGKAMLAEQPDVLLLDVRTPQEFDTGHIEGAILLPYDEIPLRLDDVLADKDAPIIIYCRSGRRSAIAADLLVKAGYSQVYDMGGIISWPYGLVQG